MGRPSTHFEMTSSACGAETFGDIFDNDYLPLRKILCSATMTTNPEKLYNLELHFPVMFKAEGTDLGEVEQLDPTQVMSDDEEDGKYQLPEGLSEIMVKCTSANKPLMLVHLLMDIQRAARVKGDALARRVLVFAASVQAAHRLTKILRKMDIFGGTIEELSSLQSQKARSKAIAHLRSGEASVVVSSDVMARGIDIEKLDHVINYDPATHPKTYVHRVGRTARAQRKGTSYASKARSDAPLSQDGKKNKHRSDDESCDCKYTG